MPVITIPPKPTPPASPPQPRPIKLDDLFEDILASLNSNSMITLQPAPSPTSPSSGGPKPIEPEDLVEVLLEELNAIIVTPPKPAPPPPPPSPKGPKPIKLGKINLDMLAPLRLKRNFMSSPPPFRDRRSSSPVSPKSRPSSSQISLK